MAVVAGTIYLASLVPRHGGIFSFDEAGAHGSLSITEDWCYDIVQGNSQYNACEVAPQRGTPGNWARWLMTPGVERPWVLGWDDTNAGSCATWTCFETLSCYCKYVPPSMRSITTLTLREVTGYRKVDIAIPELRQAPVVQAASWDNDVLHVVYSTGSPNLEGALQLYHVKLEIF